MRVVLNAQLNPHGSGGIAEVVAALASSLGRLSGPEEYVFVCTPVSALWLQPFLGPNSTMAINRVSKPGPRRGARRSDGFWESFKPDVLHFPYQSFTVTGVPSVFNPHDLQHVHLPQMFSTEEIERRESLYFEACHSAAAVVVAGDWARQDFCRHYHLEPQKVHAIRWGSPLELATPPGEDQVREVLRRFELQPGFGLYPAQTWPHKNHLGLLDAMAIVPGKSGTAIRLVCTGTHTDFFPEIVRRCEGLNLGGTVRFLGRVGKSQLAALYKAASFVVVPTLFDPASFPVLDAFALGIAVACSAAGGLPEQVGDAALLFDPQDPQDLRRCMQQIHSDAGLRQRLIQRGRRRIAACSWPQIASQYRDLYRSLAGAT